MLLDAQMEVAARVAYIIRITRITLIFIHNAFSCASRSISIPSWINTTKDRPIFTSILPLPRKIWMPYLWDAFDEEKETDSEHSKWLHSSETVYLKKFPFFCLFPFCLFYVIFHLLLYIKRSLSCYNLHLITVTCRRRNA